MSDHSDDQDLSVSRKLEKYLGGREIKPTAILNTEKGRQEPVVKGLEIELHYGIDAIYGLTINSKKIILKGKSSINQSNAGSKGFYMGFFRRWGRAAFYETKAGNLALIEFLPQGCDGLTCGQRGYLLYDLKTGEENWFTSYFEGNGFRLFDFGGDGIPDYLASTYFGNHLAGGFGHRYEFFTRQPSGTFRVAKDDSGSPFYFKRVFQGPWDPYKFIELDSRIEQHWFEKIP